MIMLTKQDIKNMNPGIFRSGVMASDKYDYLVNDRGVNVDGQYNKFYWVAVRGDIPDWAVYIMPAKYWGKTAKVSDRKVISQRVANYGTKIHDLAHVNILVPSEADALSMYRH